MKYQLMHSEDNGMTWNPIEDINLKWEAYNIWSELNYQLKQKISNKFEVFIENTGYKIVSLKTSNTLKHSQTEKDHLYSKQRDKDFKKLLEEGLAEGKRIEVVKSTEVTLSTGLQGTVDEVKEAHGKIWVDWDNNSACAILIPQDTIKIL